MNASFAALAVGVLSGFLFPVPGNAVTKDETECDCGAEAAGPTIAGGGCMLVSVDWRQTASGYCGQPPLCPLEFSCFNNAVVTVTPNAGRWLRFEVGPSIFEITGKAKSFTSAPAMTDCDLTQALVKTIDCYDNKDCNPPSLQTVLVVIACRNC